MSENGIQPRSVGGGDLAVIGEGTPHQTSISVQILQNIYHELTGKSEEVSKSYDDPYQIGLSDFDQLNHRISQVCEQFNICSNNCSVIVYYFNDTTDTFSSFERFRAFNAGSTSAVESVLLTYNFLILLPKLNEPQSYTASIRIASPVTVEAKMRSDLFFEMPKILRLLGNRNAVVSVKYIDYVVARNLLNAVDEWFGTLQTAYLPKPWKFLRKHTDYLPLITRYVVGASSVLIVFLALPHFLTPNSTWLEFGRVMLLSGAGIFAAYKLAHHLGSAAEDSVDLWFPLSYIELTAGDRTQIKDATRRNRISLLAGILKFVAGLLVSVILKVVVERLIP